jgi:hypothetical protein
MSLYQKDYKEVIRSYKEKQLAYMLSKEIENPFETFYVDLTSIFNPIDQQYMFKKSFVSHHTYEMENPSTVISDKKNISSFQSLLGSDGLIRKFQKISSNPDDDYLTGYYLGKFHIEKCVKNTGKSKRIQLIEHNAFMFGGAKQNFLLGMSQALKDDYSKLNGYVVDLKKIKSNKVNTFIQSLNILSVNTIKSVRIYLKENIKNPCTIYISDIYPNNVQILWNSIVIPLTDLDQDAISVIRFPLMQDWAKYYASICNLLIFLSSQFNYLRLFKTPWSEKPRYYLIFKEQKEVFPMKKLTALLKYIEELTTNVQFISKTFFNDDDATLYLNNICEKYTELSNEKLSLGDEETNVMWLEKVMGIEDKQIDDLKPEDESKKEPTQQFKFLDMGNLIPQ